MQLDQYFGSHLLVRKFNFLLFLASKVRDSVLNLDTFLEIDFSPKSIWTLFLSGLETYRVIAPMPGPNSSVSV